ncbi:hypothetical protein AwDysgo_15640 [Bacteroidales bacterium]|nr:hypothetical protein AwDysgo_15640 [Bacteroidales bacterium]
MKTKHFLTTALMSISVMVFISCDKADEQDNINGQEANSTPLALLSVSAEGISTYAIDNICPLLTVTDPLNADEIEFLSAMRQDEKLSRDLYASFAIAYPTTSQFARTAYAEANHVAAIEMWLSYYEITFPPLSAAGVFEDSDLQSAYDNLLAKGNTLLGALSVAAYLEEQNVASYSAVIPNSTNANIVLLLNNMVRASSNHLRAYVRIIIFWGETYSPVFIDQAAFDTIVNSAFGQGNMYAQCGAGNSNSHKGGMEQGHKGSVNQAGNCTMTVTGTAPGASSACKGYRRG